MQLLRLGLAVIALILVWLLWGGLYKTPVLQLGIASCCLVVWLTHRMALPDQETHSCCSDRRSRRLSQAMKSQRALQFFRQST